MSLDIHINKFSIAHLLVKIKYKIFSIKRYHHRHLKAVYEYLLKTCSFIKEKKEILKQKFSTVATYANELDSVQAKETTNFEYDDHEWDVGIGNLIINLDADIEKTRNEKLNSDYGMASTPSSSTSKQIQNLENLTYTFNENGPHSDNTKVSSIVSTSSSILPAVSCNIITHSYNLVNIVSTANDSSKVTTSTSRTNSNANISETDIRKKMTVEHLATADKGLKMKIKRTKSGTKFSEAKHEIVKSNELDKSKFIQDGHKIVNTTVLDSSSVVVTSTSTNNTVEIQSSQSQHKIKASHLISTGSNAATVNIVKRNVCNRREKGRDKYEKSQNINVSQDIASEVIGTANQIIQTHSPFKTISETFSSNTMLSSITSVHPITSSAVNNYQSTPNPLENYSSHTTGSSSLSNVTNVQYNITKTTSLSSQKINESPSSLDSAIFSSCQNKADVFNSLPSDSVTSNFNEKSDSISDSPPAKKIKNFVGKYSKETSDVCVGTSIGINTEPDCLGPCEPGTSVTLEGIVWHETDGGILVVNITWRGKTYVGTLLDCTRHDWAPPRFCDSPTSDLDLRTSKSRVKRGRTSSSTVSCNDSLNFTETRSSMHSKLRNNGSKTRRGIYGSMAISTCSTPFISPRSDSTIKRKTRCIDEDDNNKRKVTTTLLNISPSTSPVLLECPEPNCFKKYKHINGLKYHQSHAHGLMEEDETKEGITSTSENDESNIDIPSPITPMKSPTESTGSNSNILKNASTICSEHMLDESSLSLQLTFPTVQVQSVKLLDEKDTKFKNKECSENNLTSLIIQSSPTEPRCESEICNSDIAKHSCTISLDLKESLPLYLDLSQKHELSNSALISEKLQNDKKKSVLRTDQVLPMQRLVCQDPVSIELPLQLEQNSTKGDIDQRKLNFSKNESSEDKNEQLNHIEEVVLSQNHNSFEGLSEQTLCQAKDINELTNTFSANSAQTKSVQTNLQSFADISINTKISQFKVKPTADLMPEDDKNKDSKIPKNIMYKKKTRKSPINSPQRLNVETSNINADREDLQSPAYSDISDDTISSEVVNTCEKLVKEDGTDVKSAQNNLIPHFSMYPYFSPSSYLMKSSPEKIIEEAKIDEPANKSNSKLLNSIPYSSLVNMQNRDLSKDKKDCPTGLLSSQLQSHYYSNYNTYLSSGYSFQNQDGNSRTLNSFSDSEFINQKNKIKQESELKILKDKHLDNQQILKESIEIKSQMNPYQLYHNSHSQQPSSTATIGSDDRRFYIYTGDPRRKDESETQIPAPKSLSLSPKENLRQDKMQEMNKSDENKIRTEGVKPTMETHGPPPPPTSQYAYIHPGYITSHHYGGISFDSEHHEIYRNLTPMLMSSAYTSNPYLHQLTRYDPEDLSRPLNGKAIDIVHHSNQYYPLHKIHELQERAIKSPITKSQTPSTNTLHTAQSMSIKSPNDSSNSISLGSTTVPLPPSFNIKQQSQNNSHHQQQQTSVTKDSNITSLNKGSDRSPPPQRHVHTHHHTHVGLGYPILPGQYPATYGAAVLASQQAAAVAATVISPFPPK